MNNEEAEYIEIYGMKFYEDKHNKGVYISNSKFLLVDFSVVRPFDKRIWRISARCSQYSDLEYYAENPQQAYDILLDALKERMNDISKDIEEMEKGKK